MTEATIAEVKTNTTIDNLIASIKSLWGTTQSNYMKMGEHFAHLRSETDKYQKNEKTGISYAAAVQKTGVPRSTAEFYRSLYETCADNNIPTSVFLALQDSGVNLANERFEAAREMKELRTVDSANGEAVSTLATKIKEQCPATSTSEGSLMERINRLQSDVAGFASELSKLPAVDKATAKQKADRSFYEKELKKAETQLLTLQLRVIEVLVGTFGVIDVRDSFKEQTDLRGDLWSFISQVGSELASGFSPKKPAASVKSAKKQSKRA